MNSLLYMIIIFMWYQNDITKKLECQHKSENENSWYLQILSVELRYMNRNKQ